MSRVAAPSYHLLVTGTLEPLVASTCSLIIDGEAVIVIDPGMAPSQAAIIDPLRALGLVPAAITDVILSHHHPDHTLNTALFPEARVHDHWAIYDFHGRWDDAEAEGLQVSPHVRLIRTPGHSAEDISTVFEVGGEVTVFTHAWWTADYPVDDPYSPDPEQLRASRARILALADVIVPAHGAPFRPDESTPR
jgi:glyoxylase-like metal-dependent hydrolase (beta-lactamase superfamily II)